jgi:DNA polymerase-3 subunit epsilon
MNFCVIDTETSDLPQNDGRVIELAWKIFNDSGNLILEVSRIISPKGEWVMGSKAQDVHGICKEDVLKVGGIPILIFAELFKDLEENYPITLVGHNISFDLEMLEKDMKRDEIDGGLDFIPCLCTQELGKKYLGLKDSDKLSLDELHRKLFNKGVSDAHGALEDVNATADCFFKLRR